MKIERQNFVYSEIALIQKILNHSLLERSTLDLPMISVLKTSQLKSSSQMHNLNCRLFFVEILTL